jgi:hypothetical protein
MRRLLFAAALFSLLAAAPAFCGTMSIQTATSYDIESDNITSYVSFTYSPDYDEYSSYRWEITHTLHPSAYWTDTTLSDSWASSQSVPATAYDCYYTMLAVQQYDASSGEYYGSYSGQSDTTCAPERCLVAIYEQWPDGSIHLKDAGWHRVGDRYNYTAYSYPDIDFSYWDGNYYSTNPTISGTLDTTSFTETATYVNKPCDPNTDPNCACDPNTDPNCACDPNTDPNCACDPNTDPSCSCDPATDPSCSCDPSVDPTCGCDPYTDPTCGCDPYTDPTCGCDPYTDPTCGCDPYTDPTCGGGGGGGGCDPDFDPDCCDWFGCNENQDDPIIVNLTAGPWRLTSASDGVSFDIHATGKKVKLGWTARGSNLAFLALDRNGNGVIDDGSELFGNATPLRNSQPAPNGFAALAQYDANGDGVINFKDQIWKSLLLWVDANHDGVCQRNELTPIAKSKITSITLARRWTGRRDRSGNRYRYKGFLHMGKRSQSFFDVFLVPQR